MQPKTECVKSVCAHRKLITGGVHAHSSHGDDDDDETVENVLLKYFLIAGGGLVGGRVEDGCLRARPEDTIVYICEHIQIFHNEID